MRTLAINNMNKWRLRIGLMLFGILGCGEQNDDLLRTEEPAALSTVPLGVAVIPSLGCPLPSCKVGGYGFGDSWGFASCGGKRKRHTGVDLAARAGTSVTAPEDGQIVKVYSAGGCWGQAMLISHRDAWGNTYLTQLMHIAPGKRSGAVKRGEVVATVAPLDPAMGCIPHLHFGVWNDNYKEPESWRGALPDPAVGATCGGDQSFPASWEDPSYYAPIP